MSLNTLLIIIITVELILLTSVIIISVKSKFKKCFVLSQLIVAMLAGVILLVTSMNIKIENYDSGKTLHNVVSLEYNDETKLYSITTDDNISNNSVKFIIFSLDINETKYMEDATVEYKTLLGIKLKDTCDLIVARPNIDIDSMSVSRRKSYIEDLNNRRFSLW